MINDEAGSRNWPVVNHHKRKKAVAENKMAALVVDKTCLAIFLQCIVINNVHACS